ncbi:MAG: hypothetical protein HGB34_02090 [Candidatus Moranbacteria bacterium]|nr:hypothetical protein [Candidatus Moranbacteria bacterium]NTW75668.1 hypothetical protein [Candidatus Moranbacteria bacterium]
MQSQAYYIQESGSRYRDETSPEDEAMLADHARRRYFNGIRAEYQERLSKLRSSHPTMIMYAPAFVAAGLKDLLDIALSPTGFGHFLLSVLFGFLIFMLLKLVKTNSAITESRMLVKGLMRQALIMIGFSLTDGMPLIGAFPFEIAAVALIFILDRAASTTFISKFVAAYQVTEKQIKHHS